MAAWVLIPAAIAICGVVFVMAHTPRLARIQALTHPSISAANHATVFTPSFIGRGNDASYCDDFGSRRAYIEERDKPITFSSSCLRISRFCVACCIDSRFGILYLSYGRKKTRFWRVAFTTDEKNPLARAGGATSYRRKKTRINGLDLFCRQLSLIIRAYLVYLASLVTIFGIEVFRLCLPTVETG